jgi:hypothetical protein
MFLKNKYIRISLSFAAVCGAAFLFFAAFAHAASGDSAGVKTKLQVREALAVVNADTVFTSDLDSALIKFHSGFGQEKREQFDYRKLLTKLVNDKLLVQEARTMGLDKEEWLLKQLQKIRREKAIRRYVEDNFKQND